MLHLEAGVHLEEGDRPVLGDEELTRAGADVVGLAQDRLGALVEAADLVVGEERRGRLLDQLLVAPLQRAVAGGDHDDVAVLVGEALGLDVARLVEELLHEALATSERGLGLTHRRLEGVGDLLLLAGDLQAATAATEGSLDRDRKAVLLGEGDGLVGVLERVLGAGRERSAHLLGDVAGLDLVAEVLDRLGRRADPDEPGVDDGLGEVAVLGEEAVARVHGVGAGLLGGGDDLLDVEVGVRRGGAAQRVRLVGETDEESVPVGVGVHRHAADACVLARPDDPDRDLASVGDQNLLQRLDVWHDSPRVLRWSSPESRTSVRRYGGRHDHRDTHPRLCR